MDDIKYLADKIIGDIYIIIKFNLENGAYDFIYTEGTYSDNAFTSVTADSFYNLINAYSDSIVHHSDSDKLVSRLSKEALTEYFNGPRDELSLWFRLLSGNDYRWVLMRLLPANDYSTDNPVYLCYVLDDKSFDEVGITTAVLGQINYLNAFSSIYLSMHLLDLKKDNMIRFRIIPQFENYINTSGSLRDIMNDIISKTVTSVHRERALTFTDLSTLEQRLKNKKVISDEFIGVNYGWFRAQFIAVDYDNEGHLETVFFTTQRIDDEKKREEQLIIASTTDGLTRLYNRRCYEDDIVQIEANGIPDNFVIVSLDVNGLKAINDTKGHAIGDELLKGVATCMNKALAKYGKIYRMGGDEFTAIIYIDSKKIKERIKKLNLAFEKWECKYLDNISASLGIASAKEFPGYSITELAKIADQRMYKSKAEYKKLNAHPEYTAHLYNYSTQGM